MKGDELPEGYDRESLGVK